MYLRIDDVSPEGKLPDGKKLERVHHAQPDAANIGARCGHRNDREDAAIGGRGVIVEAIERSEQIRPPGQAISITHRPLTRTQACGDTRCITHPLATSLIALAVGGPEVMIADSMLASKEPGIAVVASHCTRHRIARLVL